MALPAPVQHGVTQEPREQLELGTIGVSLATQPQAWPLAVAASLVDAYRAREQRLPDLDVVVASRTVECHCTPDLWQQKAYAPFRLAQTTLPVPLLNLATSSAPTRAGYLLPTNTVWLAGPQTYFWNLSTNEVKEFALSSEAVVDVAAASPDKRVFSDEVEHLLVVSTAREMQLFAVDKKGETFATGLAIPIEGLGAPKVRGSAVNGRIFFTCENTGTSIWEFRYAAKESWFRPKVQRVCHGEYGGLFGGLFGTGPTSKPDAERVLNFVVDDSVSALYALTTKSAIHVYDFDARGTSFALVRNLSSAQIRSALALGYTTPAPSLAFTSISAVPASASNYIRLVAVTAGGDRVYFRSNDRSRSALQLQPAYIQRPPVPEEPKKEDAKQDAVRVKRSVVIDGRTTYAATADHRVLASSVDDARTAHQTDMRQPVSFVELSGWFKVDGDVLAVVPGATHDLVLTASSLYRVQRRPFSDRFEYADAPFALAQVYGPMQLCCGALTVAAQSSSRATREMAIAAFFRFGGLPMFRRDQMQPGFLGHASIRLSSSFDGLGLYIAKLLGPLWGSRILGAGDAPPQAKLLDAIYRELSGLVALLDQNRSFSEGMSERSGSYAGSVGDDAALLSQTEYKGLQALGRLAKSSQEGIAFLKLVLTQYDTRELLSYFDENKMPRFRQLTFGEFFTAAKNSDVARELVNSLVNHVLNKGDSVDAITSVIQDRCASYCSTGDVLEYKALEYIHQSKQNRGHTDTASLARSVALVRKAAATIQLDTLRDIVRDYVELKYYCGAVQAALAVAAEQDPANLAVGFLRQRNGSGEHAAEPAAKRQQIEAAAAIPAGTSADRTADHTVDGTADRRVDGTAQHRMDHTAQHRMDPAHAGEPTSAVGRPVSESELKFRAKRAVFEIIFSEVLNPHPELAATSSPDLAHSAMVNSTDEVWHFALYDWYLAHDQQDQVALLDTPFVASYLQLGAPHDLKVANLLWKWHQRHNDLLAAADVLLDLARGPLVPLLSQRVEYLSRAMGYCQAQPQHTQQAVNMTTMVRAYLGLALLQSDVLSKLGAAGADASAQDALNTHLFTISELFNDWAEPYGLYDVCFAIFEFADFRDAVEIRKCWANLLTKARIEDDREKTAHYAHVSSILAQLGAKYRNVDTIFPVPDIVPMLEQYAVDYTPNAPVGWIIDALLNAGVSTDVLTAVYSETLRNKLLEGDYQKHAEESLAYLNQRPDSSDVREGRRLAV